MGLKARASSEASEVGAFVARIRALYAREDVPLGFKSGATRADIEKYRRAVNQSVSKALGELWRMTDGTTLPVLTRPGYYCSYSLMSIAESSAKRASMERYLGNYRDYEEPRPRDPRIRPGWYHTDWVPFAASVASLWLIEDHAPIAGGSPGQIIGYVHDPDQIVWVASSLRELLPICVAQLEEDPEEYGIEW